MSGSTPVVSQSIMNPMVPVGASTVAWALRMPTSAPCSTTRFQLLRAASRMSWGTVSLASIISTWARWRPMTPIIDSAFRAKPANGPLTRASSTLWA